MKGKSRRSETDWSRADKIPAEPDDELPEVTKADLDRATLSVGGVPIWGPGKRGRPPGSGKKSPVHVRLDKEVLNHFRATGRGWQTRLNDVLRRAVESEERAKGRAKKRMRKTSGAAKRSA
jgi:uncharacterized protein (DUF4415 family)